MTASYPDTARPPPLDVARRIEPPGLAAAVGLIALYFLLQAVASGLIALLMAVATGFVQIDRGIQPVGAEIRAMLAQPGMLAIVVMLTLCLAAALVIALVRWQWPALWSMAHSPGFGMLLPVNPAFFVLAVAVGMAAPLLGGLLTSLLANGKTVTQDVQNLGMHTPLGLRLALVVVVTSVGPLVEEILFRGVLLSALTKRWRIGWSVVISALLFAVSHLPSMQWQWYALPDLMLLAGALAWLRLRARSLWPAVLAHGVNNLLAVAAWFVTTGSV
ncbi:CPBP family intramembrane glutamic endopeptidase [Rhodanobacter sp. BL-MT-08]